MTEEVQTGLDRALREIFKGKSVRVSNTIESQDGRYIHYIIVDDRLPCLVDDANDGHQSYRVFIGSTSGSASEITARIETELGYQAKKEPTGKRRRGGWTKDQIDNLAFLARSPWGDGWNLLSTHQKRDAAAGAALRLLRSQLVASIKTELIKDLMRQLEEALTIEES